jgi:myosin-5
LNVKCLVFCSDLPVTEERTHSNVNSYESWLPTSSVVRILEMSYVVGDRFWIPDAESAWLVGTLKSASAAMLEFNTEQGVKKVKVSDMKTKLETCGSHIDDNVENLVDLDELSEGAILHHTRIRFQKKIIYTHVGSILVAVNPFEALNIYGDRDIRRAVDSSQPYPHVFVTASTAYQQLKTNLKNQAVLISGESGGKITPLS